MRVCFIGDSHLACIKQGWDREVAQHYPHIAATFFALPGRGINRLEVRDGTLGSDEEALTRVLKITSGGHDRIESSFDAYILHGMHLSVVTALELLRSAPDRGRIPWPDQVASQGFCNALRGKIENAGAVALLRKLREITRAPAIVAPTPSAEMRLRMLRQRLVETFAALPLAALFNEVSGLVCLDLDAVFVPQSPQTLAGDGLATRAEYSEDAVRFSARAAKDDASHMNAAYGAIAVSTLMKALSEMTANQSAATSAAL